MSKQKSKAVVVELNCPCGAHWTACYPTGKLKSTCKCRSCGNFIKTDGTSRQANKQVDCMGCKRPLINNHHCTYCGRPVNEKATAFDISKEPQVQFCTDDNMPGRKAKRSV